MTTEMLDKPLDEKELNLAIAQMEAFCVKWDKRFNFQADFVADVKALKHEVQTLLNGRAMLEKLNRLAAIEKEKAEQEAQTRLASVEKGHQALVAELTKKQLACDAKLAELEKREALTNAEKHRAELTVIAYEQKLKELAAVTHKKAKA